MFKVILENWQGLTSGMRAPFEAVAGVRPYKEWKRREQWKKSKQKFRERKRREKKAKVTAGNIKSKGKATRRTGGSRDPTESTNKCIPKESQAMPIETPPPMPEPVSESPSTMPMPYHPVQHICHHKQQQAQVDNDKFHQYSMEIEPIPCSSSSC